MELGPYPLKVLLPLAYPLAYLAGGAGLWKLIHWFFKFPEEQLSGDMKETIAIHLLEADPAKRVRNWPEALAKIFDAVFTKKHLSWKCFRRSCLVSLATVGIMTIVWIGLNPDAAGELRPSHELRVLLEENFGIDESWNIAIVSFFMLLTALAFNLGPDYFSLLAVTFQ